MGKKSGKSYQTTQISVITADQITIMDRGIAFFFFFLKSDCQPSVGNIVSVSKQFSYSMYKFFSIHRCAYHASIATLYQPFLMFKLGYLISAFETIFLNLNY